MENCNLKVSIIIPTYRRVNMLERAIKSVLNQTYSNYEIIVVDDNNEGDEYRKGTELFMQKFLSEKRLIYLKHEINKGASEARNTGIKYSNAEFISFLDDDDEYYPDKIEKQVKYYQNYEKNSNSKLGFIYCGMSYYDEKNNKIVGSLQLYLTNAFSLFYEQMKRGVIGTPSLLIPKNVFNEVGGFKTLKCGQDYELVLRILSNNYEVGCIKEPLVKVGLHNSDNITKSLSKDQYIKYFLEIKTKYLKYFSDYQRRAILLESDYEYFRFYCKQKQFKIAIRYIYKILKYKVFDWRIPFLPLFIILPNFNTKGFILRK